MRKIKSFLTYPPYRPFVLLLAAILCFVPVVAFAAPLVQDLPPDPASTEVHNVILFFISALVGAIGTGLMQFIKDKTGLADTAALLITYGVSLVIAVVELVILGWFVPEMLSVDNLPLLFGAIFSGATGFYKLLVKPRQEAEG